MDTTDELTKKLLDKEARKKLDYEKRKILKEGEERKKRERDQNLKNLEREKVYKERALVETKYVLRKFQSEKTRINSNYSTKQQESKKVEDNLKKEQENLDEISKKYGGEVEKLTKELTENKKILEEQKRKVVELEKRKDLAVLEVESKTRGIRSIISRLLGVVEGKRREVQSEENKRKELEQKIQTTQRTIKDLESDVNILNNKIVALKRN